MDKERLSRLVGGDLLLIPSLRGMCFSAVLRVGSSGELYLSHVSVKQVAGEAQALSNPFSWDDDVGALVDRDGDVPLWYSSGIDVEQAGATQAGPRVRFDTACGERQVRGLGRRHDGLHERSSLRSPFWHCRQRRSGRHGHSVVAGARPDGQVPYQGRAHRPGLVRRTLLDAPRRA